MNKTAPVILAALCVSLTLADDFKTNDGKQYKNVTVSRVEPDGIVLMTKSGILKLYFTELPKDVQQRFHYDLDKAAAYSADQNAALKRAGKQQEKRLRQKTEATRTKNQPLSRGQSGIRRAGEQRQSPEALEARYQQLQQQEADLLSQIGGMQTLPDYVQGRSGRHFYSYRNPLRANLPILESQLSDVRREKVQVKEQLDLAPH